MTIAGLVILLLIIIFVVCNILSIIDLSRDEIPRIVPGVIAIMGWVIILIFIISFGLASIDWNYKLF